MKKYKNNVLPAFAYLMTREPSTTQFGLNDFRIDNEIYTTNVKFCIILICSVIVQRKYTVLMIISKQCDAQL